MRSKCVAARQEILGCEWPKEPRQHLGDAGAIEWFEIVPGLIGAVLFSPFVVTACWWAIGVSRPHIPNLVR